MEKKKTSLSLRNGTKSRKAKDTLPNPVTPTGNGKSFERSILKDFASNLTNLSETLPSKSRNNQGVESTEKCENRSFDFHCSFDTDGSQEIDIPCTQLVSQEKILEGVVAFIEARSNTENRSEGISKQMEMLGARVAKKFTPEVTHVIFKDGKKTTREKALKRGIHLVSVLWVESCKQSGKRVSEELFPVVNPEEIGTPLIIGKLKRTKSMQPKAFEEDVKNSAERGERRRRRKMHAENWTPSAMIFCEESQDPPCSPFVRHSPTTPHVVPDTPNHKAAVLFTFNKKLDYEDEPTQETLKLPEPMESTLDAVDQSHDRMEEAPVEIPKLKRRLLSNRTPGKPVSTLKEATITPTTQTNKTPTDVLLTGSEQLEGRKRKRIESTCTRESQSNEDNKGPTRTAKKVKFDGQGVSSENREETMKEDLGVMKQTVDALENKAKASGNTTRQRKNLPSQDNDGAGSDSGVSSPGENFKSSTGKRKVFSKTEKLVEQVTETQEVEEISDMERHESKKKGNAPTTAKKPNIKPDKPISQIKEHSTQLSKFNGNPLKNNKSVERKEAAGKGKFADTETLEGGEEGSEEEDEEQREGETCTEDEEQGSYQRRSSTTKKARAKLVKKVKPKRSLVMTSMHFDQQDVVVSVVRKLGGFFIEDRVSAATSHVIAGSPRRTLNVLMAIAHGHWLVSPMWIMKSLEVGYWVDEEPYELSDAFPAAQLCRLERVSSGPGYQQDLLSDCAPIFVSENCSPPSDALMTLINLCGGKVCASVRKAGICIGTMTKRTQAINITEQWLLDCITQHLVLPFTKYALNSPAKRGRETSPSY